MAGRDDLTVLIEQETGARPAVKDWAHGVRLLSQSRPRPTSAEELPFAFLWARSQQQLSPLRLDRGEALLLRQWSQILTDLSGLCLGPSQAWTFDDTVAVLRGANGRGEKHQDEVAWSLCPIRDLSDQLLFDGREIVAMRQEKLNVAVLVLHEQIHNALGRQANLDRYTDDLVASIEEGVVSALEILTLQAEQRPTLKELARLARHHPARDCIDLVIYILSADETDDLARQLYRLAQQALGNDESLAAELQRYQLTSDQI